MFPLSIQKIFEHLINMDFKLSEIICENQSNKKKALILNFRDKILSNIIILS